MTALLPPVWLIRVAVALVWLYEGLWCKILGRQPRQFQVVEAVPRFGPSLGTTFLRVLGVGETAIAAWVLSGVAPVPCALAQTLLLLLLNASGLLFARHLIHDPGEMLVKNFALLVLAWVAASLPGWR